MQTGRLKAQETASHTIALGGECSETEVDTFRANMRAKSCQMLELPSLVTTPMTRKARRTKSHGEASSLSFNSARRCLWGNLTIARHRVLYPRPPGTTIKRAEGPPDHQVRLSSPNYIIAGTIIYSQNDKAVLHSSHPAIKV